MPGVTDIHLKPSSCKVNADAEVYSLSPFWQAHEALQWVSDVPHFADFVIEQPTAVLEDGEERCRTFRYSNPISLPAKNSLLAVLD
jgi:hypothetical protein